MPMYMEQEKEMGRQASKPDQRGQTICKNLWPSAPSYPPFPRILLPELSK